MGNWKSLLRRRGAGGTRRAKRAGFSIYLSDMIFLTDLLSNLAHYFNLPAVLHCNCPGIPITKQQLTFADPMNLVRHSGFNLPPINNFNLLVWKCTGKVNLPSKYSNLPSPWIQFTCTGTDDCGFNLPINSFNLPVRHWTSRNVNWKSPR